MSNKTKTQCSQNENLTITIPKNVTPRTLLDLNANAIIQKLIESAIAGDQAALRICVDRIMPRVKPENGINFELPEGRIDTGDNMLQITNGVIKSVFEGEMTIEEAERFTRFIKKQRWEIDEAERKKRNEEWKERTGF
jgi:hypothetical protein